MSNVVRFARPAPEPRRGHQCACGAFWRPGFSSDPGWLLTADPIWDSFVGVTHCHCCGRRKLDVLREQAEARRAAEQPAIVVEREERPAAPVVELRPRGGV